MCIDRPMGSMNLLRTNREATRALQVDTDVLFGIGSLVDIDTRDSEVGTGSLGRTVNVDNGVTSRGDGTSDATDGNTRDGQGARIVTVTVALLVLVTVVRCDNNRIVHIDQTEANVLYIRNFTLSTRPGLDTHAVLTIGAAAAQDTNHIDIFSRAAFAKGPNAETVAADTVDIAQRDVGHTTVDSQAVITHGQVRVLKDDTLRRGNIQGIRVLGKVFAGRDRLEGDIVKNQILRVGDAQMSSGGVDDVDSRDFRVCKAEAENSRRGVVLGIIPIITC